MQPNLARIPADGDADAKAILKLARGGVTADLLGCMVRRDCIALGSYATRQVTVALREGSAVRLRAALFAKALGDAAAPDGDQRDDMIGLALFHVVARQVGLVPSELFNETASRLPDGPVPDLLRVFGARQDVTLEAFGWELVQTPDGPDFVPAPW